MNDRIENALPGRESFDIEIYGMEGIPCKLLCLNPVNVFIICDQPTYIG
jgi:hypothetical protein